ncbi:MAG: response regulator [Thermodesulfobacteriota bacterium]|nr:response regulator [Thermodesulfobacteriota bacterium]
MVETDKSIGIIYTKEQERFAENIRKIIGAGQVLPFSGNLSRTANNFNILVLLLDVYPGDEEYNNFVEYFRDTKKLPPILAISTDNNFDRFVKLKLIVAFTDFIYLKAPFNIKSLEEKLYQLNNVRPVKPRDRIERCSHYLKKVGQTFFDEGDFFKAYDKINRCLFDSESNRARQEHGIWHEIGVIKSEVIFFNDNISDGTKETKDWLGLLYKLEKEELIQDYAELIRSLRKLYELRKMKILIIDNSPKSFKHELKVINEKLGDLYKFYIRTLPLDTLSKDLTNGKVIKIGNLQDVEEKDISGEHALLDFDLILLDLHLGSNLKGEDFLKKLYQNYPGIPVFILSSNEDYNTIRETLKGGADDYIPKSRAISLPSKINQYFKKLGDLIWLAKPEDEEDENGRELRRNLIGNLRKWMFNKEILWFGDKCYHMINHSFSHAENDWKIANQIVPPIIDFVNRQKSVGNPLLEELTDEDIYCLCMAIWLHDIGHKGNERYGKAHEIRDLHGLISAELILKHPDHYGIFGYDMPDRSPYRWVSFRHPKTAPQVIRERIQMMEAAAQLVSGVGNMHADIRKMTLLERIALICIYHQSNFPLDEEDVKKIRKDGKRIPIDCYENCDRNSEPIHLKSICDMIKDYNLMRLTSLFRLIDGIDINRNRVGNETSESIKKCTIGRDLKQQVLELEKEIVRIKDSLLKSTGKEKRFVTLFYEEVRKQIETAGGVGQDLKKEQQQFLDTLSLDLPLDNYYMLVDYIQFLSVQEGHFKLHNAIDNIRIDWFPSIKDQGNRIGFKITYISRKDKDYLDNPNITVKKWSESKGRTIRGHLLGRRHRVEDVDEGKKKVVANEYRIEDGYVRREMNDGKKYLKDWLDLKNTEIKICYGSGKSEVYRELSKKV